MIMTKARRLAWGQPATAVPPPPNTVLPRLATGAFGEDDETDTLCALYEAEQALLMDAECALGCDYSDGAFSPHGCRW